VVDVGEGLAVIDPGYTGGHRRVLRLMAGLGYLPSDLRTVILTHHHVDHGGAAMALCLQTGARLAVHAADGPYLSPGRPRERMTGWGLVDRLPTALARYLVTCADRELTLLNDGDTIAGLRIIHAPGHTPGSICLWSEGHSVLFVGDVLNNEHGLRLPPWTVNHNHRAAAGAAQVLAGLAYERAYFGHGRPLFEGASQVISQFVEGTRRAGRSLRNGGQDRLTP